MKKFFLLFVFLLFYCVNLNSQTNKPFTIGAIGCYPNKFDYNITSLDNTYWDYYNELHFNTWQAWGIHNIFFCKPCNCSINTNNTLTRLNQNHFTSFFQSNYVYNLSIGHQSKHQAENNLLSDPIDGLISPYRYHYHTLGSDIDDNGIKVRYYDNLTFPDPAHQPVTILKQIVQNGELSFYDIPSQNPLKWDKWYIRPKMKIKPEDANTDKEVIRILIKAYNGEIIKTIDIKANDFNVSNNYQGDYTEYYKPSLDLSFSASIDNGINKGHSPGDFQNLWLFWYDSLNINCKVDFEIQWFGKVDVWIDYIMIRDTGAEELFNPDLAYMRTELIKEAQDLITNGGTSFNGFYTEEIFFNNIECIKEVNRLLSTLPNGGNAKVYSLINPYSYELNLKKPNPNNYKRYFALINPEKVFLAQYKFTGRFGDSKKYIPNNIKDFNLASLDLISNPAAAASIKTLTKAYFNEISKPADIYNRHLLDTVWHSYSETLEHFKQLCGTDCDLILVPQIFHEHRHPANDYPIFVEPMNSEISASQNIAICRGVKGIMNYSYEAIYAQGDNSNSLCWNVSGILFLGMTDLSGNVSANGAIYQWGKYKRLKNFYNEDKWEFLKEQNRRLKDFGYIFANSTGTQGYSLEKDGVNHNYIQDIQSIDPDLPGYSDNETQKYWELGIFFPDNSGSSDKYFMLVNKRCIPSRTPGREGEERKLHIKFKPEQLSNFNNWKLIDLYSGKSIIFDKNTPEYIVFGNDNDSNSIGYFLPGEGKLFKLSPVTQ